MSEDDTAEDDWFESALRDDEDEQSDETEDSESDTADDSSPSTSESGSGWESELETGLEPESETESGSEPDSDVSPPDDGGPSEADGQTSPDEAGGESVFVDSGEESAFGDTGAGVPFEGGTGDQGGFGTGTGGFDDGGPGDGLFDDGFEEAMGAAGGTGGGGGGTDFADEELDTDIPRIDVGIEGLDNMIQGGIPMRHLIVVIGGAGTGKTTFGLQFLEHGLEKDDVDKGVFITLEQTYEDIMATADERDWNFEHHEEEGNLAVIDLDPIEMANSLDNIHAELPDLIEAFGADRFVLDSVSLLEMMYEDVARRRTEVFDFTQSLKDAGVTTILTSEANDDNPYASRHGIIEYLTDAVFLLRYVRSETQETRLAVEIQKIRNANHSRETKPYEITIDGISVYEQANIF